MIWDAIRKSFDVNIYIKKWYYKKRVNVKFEQASMYEINEFIFETWQDWFQLANWIVDFVENHTKQKLYYFDRKSIAIKFKDIFEILQDTYFGWAFEKWNSKETEDDDDLLASYIVFLSSELKQDPLYLMKNYTIQQLKFFTDWIVRNINDKSEKWKKENRLKKIGNNNNYSKESVNNLLQRLDIKKCNEASK